MSKPAGDKQRARRLASGIYDWDAAFALYYELGAERSYRKLAEELGCDITSVSRAASRDGWQDRLAAIEEKARASLDGRYVRDRAERVAATLRLIDTARDRFVRQLAYADFRLTGADMVGLIKLEQLLEGQATERVSIVDVLGEQLGALIGAILDDFGVLDRPDAGEIVQRRLLALETGDVPSGANQFVASDSETESEAP